MTKTYCDTCGKVLGKNDYDCKQIKTIYEFITLDICWECYEKLAREMKELVEKYAKGGGDNETT